MPKGAGIHLDGKIYNVVQDHETYVVSDVPAHPDSDSRMERRVMYDMFKGYLKRRSASNPLDQSIYAMNIYNRVEKAGDGAWFSWGCDTRMTDRIFGQRLVQTSQAPASPPLFFIDSTKYSFIVCLKHVYSISGIVNGVQQIVLSKDFSGISPSVNIVDAASFNGRIYIATAQLTNGRPDPSKPQVMWVWDQNTTNTNWTNPPVPLSAATWPAGALTTTAAAFGASGVSTFTVGSTTGMPGAGTFNVTIDNEILAVTHNSGTVLNVITRGVLGSPATAHQTGAAVTYNPAVTVSGTAGQTRWQYYLITTLAGQDSAPSVVQTVTFGASTLTATNYNILTFNTVAGQGYTVFRTYAGGNPNSVGIISQGTIIGTGSTISFNDTGLPVIGLQAQITPQFAIGDGGNAMAYAVIRNTLWRAEGPRMWAWDGQQATWSGESVIGDPNTNITALDIFQDGLIIFKQDGIYTMNRTSDVFPLFPGFKTLGLNPRPLGQWQGQYYFASDVGMVWEWNGDQVKSIGFDYAEAYPFPDGTFGLPNAVTKGVGMPNFFLVGFNKFNSNNNSAFFLAYDGIGWHPFHYDPDYQASGLGFTGGNTLPSVPTIQFGKSTWNALPSGVNLLSSPGFEIPNGDWILGANGTGLATIDNTNPHTDSLAMKMTNPSAGNYGTSYNRKGIPVGTLTQITVSAWMKTTGASASTGPIRITFANPGTNISSGGIASAQPSAQAGIAAVDFNPVITTSYAPYSTTVAVPGGYSWIFIEIYSNANGTANPVFIDDVSIANSFGFAISYLTSPTLDPYLITSYDTIAQVLFLPVDSGIIADEFKVLEGIRMFIENSTTGTVRIAYATDDNIFKQIYVDLGAPQNDRTTVQTFIPSGQLPVYRKIMFKVTLTPDANIATPIIRMVMHRYKQRESQRKSWTIQLFLEEGQMNPNRNKESRTAQQMLAQLNKARKNQNLVEFKDLVGDTYMVYVESVGEALKTYRTKDMNTSFTAKVILVETAEVAND